MVEDRRYSISMPVQNDEGLKLMFYATKRDIPSPLPRFCYSLDNQRIRGIDWHFFRPGGDGSVVKGWHEHVFTDKHQDNFIVPSSFDHLHIPQSKHIDFVLSRWKIDISQYKLGL